MKKIYITGICGMLGANLAYLLKDKYIVVGCDVYKGEMEGVTVEYINLLDSEALEQSVLRYTPDIVIHTAAMVNVDACEEEQELAHSMNYGVTDKLCQICKHNNIKLIYISTDAVFDGEKSGLYRETDEVNPLNIYAKTKLMGEKVVLNEINNTVLRTNIYGFNYQDKNSFGEWVYKSLLDDKELNMFEDILFSPILVNDLAEIIHLVIEADLEGLYHACATGSISKYDFGIALKKCFNINMGKINKTTSDTFN